MRGRLAWIPTRPVSGKRQLQIPVPPDTGNRQIRAHQPRRRPRHRAPFATQLHHTRERTRVVAPEPVAVRALAERRPEVATRLAELLLARFRAGR